MLTMWQVMYSDLHYFIISEQTCMMSFSHENYSVMEDEKVVTVSVKKSGCSNSHVVVLIATHPSEGTAIGKYTKQIHIDGIFELKKEM